MDPFVARFSIFVLAIFIGYFVVWSVTPALHTPLMSVTNAISSVIVVGAARRGSKTYPRQLRSIWARVLGFVALTFASRSTSLEGFWSPSACLGCTGRKETGAPADERRSRRLLYLLAAVLFILSYAGCRTRRPAAGVIYSAWREWQSPLPLRSPPILPEGAGAWALVIVGIAIGGTVGAVIARRVPMTAMPELVAAFHSLVGMAAVLVAAATLCAGGLRHRG